MIRVTDKAREKMIGVLIDEGSSFLRFGLQGGGCNGFTYFFAIEDSLGEDDFEFKLDDTHSLLVDPMSGMYLTDAEIDYKKDLMGEAFVFNNPNTVGSCGCGSSVAF